MCYNVLKVKSKQRLLGTQWFCDKYTRGKKLFGLDNNWLLEIHSTLMLQT